MFEQQAAMYASETYRTGMFLLDQNCKILSLSLTVIMQSHKADAT